MDELTIFEDRQLGLRPHYFAEGGETHAASIGEIFRSVPTFPRMADEEGLRQVFARKPDGIRTCYERVRKVPVGHALRPRGRTLVTAERERIHHKDSRSLLTLLEDALHRLVAVSRTPALALSGGLDSALLLALCQRVCPDIAVVTLATDLPGYCERELTLRTARELGAADIMVIEARAADFVAALPAAIQACETPLYNLHPVSKWLFACELRARGFDAVITGDGADQVFAGSDPRNYLPIVGAMARAAGIVLDSPFLDERVIAAGYVLGADPNKSALRRASEEILPAELVRQPKQPRHAPDFDLSEYRCDVTDAVLSKLLCASVPPKVAGPANTLWATAALMFRHLGGLL